MLDMQNVAIRFGKGPEAVADTSFHVDRQKRTVVIGETGSGKSVLLLAILGLLPQSARVSGKILFEGLDLLSLKERQMERIRGARIAYIPQGSGNGLNPLYTIGRQIDETIRKHSHVSRVEARRRTVALLERFGIEDAQRRAKAYPFEYSGGMRQRALIAMGIAANAQMILADEPTKGLDRCRIQAVIDAFHQLEGRTLLCVTHDLRLAKSIADNIVVMYASQQIESGSGRDFFAQPLHPYSAAMLSALPENGLQANMGFAPPRLDARAQCACHFLDRCPYKTERCIKMPPLLEIPDGRKVRCWKYADSAR